MKAGSSLAATGCTFEANHFDNVQVFQAASAHLADCVLRGSTAGQGALVGDARSSLIASGCAFESNHEGCLHVMDAATASLVGCSLDGESVSASWPPGPHG